MQMNDAIIIFSLINLGFFGGFSHCMGMCGPIVLSQISVRLKNMQIEQYFGLQKLKGLMLLPYHLGRIFTYSIIGFLLSFLNKNLREFAAFEKFSGILLLLAAFFFLQKGLEGSKYSKFLVNFKIGNGFLNIFTKIKDFLKPKFLNRLFQDPAGFKGFLLGVFLGFIPCGLLYGAFILAASISNPIEAAFGMFAFGVSTIPSLFAASFGSYYILKILGEKFYSLARLVILINSATLFIIAINLLI